MKFLIYIAALILSKFILPLLINFLAAIFYIPSNNVINNQNILLVLDENNLCKYHRRFATVVREGYYQNNPF